MTLPRRITFCVLLLVFATALSFGQAERGQLNGTIKDPSGAVVPGADVTLKNVGTGQSRKMNSSAQGEYVFGALAAGRYEISVVAAGFAPFQKDVDVAVGSRNTEDVTLTLAGGTSTVEVTAVGGVQVNTTDQTNSDLVSSKEIAELPTLTRNPYDLVQNAGNVTVGDNQNMTMRGAGVNINGQRSASTDVLLDGGENVDLFNATVGQTVPQDSVQELSVVTSGFTAEYGRMSGGVVNVATKSGTNNLHGSAYEYNRISALAANTYDNNAQLFNAIHTGLCANTSDRTCPGRKPVFTRNQFGFSAGGPIAKNKLFFFGNAEWLRVRSQGTQSLEVAMPQFIAASAPATQAFFKQFGTLAHPVNGQVFTVADGISQGLLTSVPAGMTPSTPFLGTVNFAVPSDAGGGAPQNTTLVVARVDYNLSNNTTMFGRYSLQDQLFFPGTVNFSPYQNFDTGQTNRNQNGTFSVSHVFSPTIVNVTKLVYNRLTNQQPLGTAPVGPTLYMNPNNAQPGFNHLIAFPGYNELTPGAAIPFGGPQNLAQFYDDLTITRGKHDLRFGGQYIYTQDNRVFGAYEEAVEALSSGKASTAFANLVAGQQFQFQGAVFPEGKFPCSLDATGKPIVTPACTLTLPVGPPNFSRSNRYHDGAAYAQDTWRVTDRFSLNLGLRWEYYGVQHNVDPNLDSNFYKGAGTNVYQQTANGFVATVPNSPIGGLWNPSYKNFAPRVGFAIDPTGQGKTSIRAGYGISYERNFNNVTFNVIQNPPNYAVVSLVAGKDVPTLPITTDNAGPLAGSSGTKALPGVSLRAPNQDIATAYAHVYSLSVQQELHPNTLLELVYSGSRGVHQYTIGNINNIGSGIIYGGADPTLNPNARLNSQYTNINARDSQGTSSYNGLTASFRSANLLNSGFDIGANYTWSHALDDLSATFSNADNSLLINLGLLDPYNPGLDYGSADYDSRHRVVVNAVWNIPFWTKSKSRVMSSLLGGWSAATIYSFRTGTPYTVYDCTNAVAACPRWIPTQSVVSSASSNPIPTGINVFNIMALPGVSATTVGNYINPLVGVSDYGDCTVPGQGQTQLCPFPANMTHRNAFTGPDNWNLNFAGYKSFKITERFSMQVRGELFNLLNHHNFYIFGPVDVSSLTPFVEAKKGGLAGAGFGGTPDERRNVQLAIRLNF